MGKRYVLHIPPFQHMNGKLAPSSTICHNKPDTSESDVQFYYGYRYTSKPDISRYALRDRARNLAEHPYTDGEEVSKALFTACVSQARQMLASSEWHERILRAFRLQSRYSRIWNYAVADLVLHGGTTPPEWRI